MTGIASVRTNGSNSCRIRLLIGTDEATKALAQQPLRAVEPRHHRAKRNVEHPGDLVVAQLAKSLEGDRVAVVWRQIRDRVTDGTLKVVARGDVLRVQPLGSRFLLEPVERDDRPPAAQG